MTTLFIVLFSTFSFAANNNFIVDGVTKTLPQGPNCKARTNTVRFYCAEASIENTLGTIKPYKPYEGGKKLPPGYSVGSHVWAPFSKYLKISKEKLKSMNLTPDMVCAGINWVKFGENIPCPNSSDFSVWWENEGGKKAICKISIPTASQTDMELIKYCSKQENTKLKSPEPGQENTYQ